MESFEDLCVKILDETEIMAKDYDFEGILRYIAEMRNQVELCRSMSKNER